MNNGQTVCDDRTLTQQPVQEAKQKSPQQAAQNEQDFVTASFPIFLCQLPTQDQPEKAK